MSKKRKTRKQKELAEKRHTLHSVQIQQTPETTVYSIKEEIKKPEKKITEIEVKSDEATVEYLKHDFRAITAASGIILAFDILLFVLLTTGTLKLGFLGY